MFQSDWLIKRAKIKQDSQNQSKRPLGGALPASGNWWFSLDIIIALLVDEKNKDLSFAPFVRPPAIAHYIMFIRVS